MSTKQESPLNLPKQTGAVEVENQTELEAYKEMYSQAIKSLEEERRQSANQFQIFLIVASPFFFVGLYSLANKLPNYSGVVIVLVIISIFLVRYSINKIRKSAK